MEEKIVIKPIERRDLFVKVQAIDSSSLITHRLAPEVVEAFMSKETGKTKKKELRNFDKEYKSCFYYTEKKKYGFPASGFYGAMLFASVACGIAKTEIKRAVRVVGDIYELRYKKLNRRVDNPRRGGINSTPDIRHRPEFIDWSCILHIQYDSSLISADQVINLINRAGFSGGIGDWRPSAPKNPGTHGMFRVSPDQPKGMGVKK